MTKPITESQIKLIKETFERGFTKGHASTATGETLENAFEDAWSYQEQTVFKDPKWKPYLESAKSSFKFCFESGFALGVYQGPVITPEKAFADWSKVLFKDKEGETP